LYHLRFVIIITSFFYFCITDFCLQHAAGYDVAFLKKNKRDHGYAQMIQTRRLIIRSVTDWLRAYKVAAAKKREEKLAAQARAQKKALDDAANNAK